MNQTDDAGPSGQPNAAMSAEARLAAAEAERKRLNREAAAFASDIGGGLKGVGKIAMIAVIGFAAFVVVAALYAGATQ